LAQQQVKEHLVEVLLLIKELYLANPLQQFGFASFCIGSVV
tara:strand:+ start:1241 stop:1363 length:123 start_codon:yes stop_codon:yes gene_type:complete